MESMEIKRAEDVRQLVCSFTEGLLNGYIFRIFVENKNSLAKSCVTLQELQLIHPQNVNELNRLKLCIKDVSNNMEILKRNINRNWKRIIDYVNQPFKFKPKEEVTVESTSTTMSSSTTSINTESTSTTMLSSTASINTESTSTTMLSSTASINTESTSTTMLSSNTSLKTAFPEDATEFISLDMEVEEFNPMDVSSCSSQSNILLRPTFSIASTNSTRRNRCSQCQVKKNAIRVLQEKNRKLKQKIASLKLLEKKNKIIHKQLMRLKSSKNLWKMKYRQEKIQNIALSKKPPTQETVQRRILKMTITKLQQKMRRLEQKQKNEVWKAEEDIKCLNLVINSKDTKGEANHRTQGLLDGVKV